MKKLPTVLLILLALALQNCKTDNSVAETPKETEASIEEVAEDVQTIEWSRFTASGNEPAWEMIIDAVDGELIYELSVGNGEVTKLGKAEIVMMKSSITSIQLEANDEIIQFQILARPCTDEAGNSFEKSIFFTTGGQKYIGCGEFAVSK